jgi:hypothetical protein
MSLNIYTGKRPQNASGGQNKYSPVFLYRNDDGGTSIDVRVWCLEILEGPQPLSKILCIALPYQSDLFRGWGWMGLQLQKLIRDPFMAINYYLISAGSISELSTVKSLSVSRKGNLKVQGNHQLRIVVQISQMDYH